jgi:hypothetical protein
MHYKLLLLSFIVFLSCNSADEDEHMEETVTVELAPEDIYAYEVNMDSMTKKRNDSLPARYLHVDSLLKGMNERFEAVRIEKVKQSNDTLYTRIPDAEYLTQRMGSAGPEFYFTSLYFNLTAVPGIRYIKVDLEEGDHAGPTLLGPENFSNYKEAK